MGWMKTHVSLMLLSLILTHSFPRVLSGEASSTQLYIVYMGEKQYDDPRLVTSLHHDLLTSLLGSKRKALASLVYSYRHSFSGFAAMLTDSQAKKLTESPGVISVQRNRIHRIHTTRSWDFVGLPYDQSQEGLLLQRANSGEDMIVGVVDTGIWPESESFNGDGYGPIPSRWKGGCVGGEGFNAMNCSRKIIGARWYTGGLDKEYLKNEYMSPRDFNGHGTHTASTIAGNLVQGVSFNGLASGTARGGAPRARLAVYKACWGGSGSCGEAAVLQALDDAINDGVDVLSLSIGGDGYPFGSLLAIRRGISVIFSAGNDGPAPQTVENVLPWTITVAASTVDRSYPTEITLGDGTKLVGQSLFYDATEADRFKELVHGGNCGATSLNKTEVAGKIVLCYAPSEVSSSVYRDSVPSVVSEMLAAGGAGLIFAQYPISIMETILECSQVPCVLVDFEIGSSIDKYLKSQSTPTAKVMLTSTTVGDQVKSPKVGAFSSRGPSTDVPQLLAPDVAAPGVSILAATTDGYILASGTSMACPHVSAVVALLKSIHPDWSPAAIKSAIVTTASITNKFGEMIEAEGLPRKIADPFDYGGGHINPNRTSDPGLIYDIMPTDYYKLFKFWPSERCSDSDSRQLYNLNLPSVAIHDLSQTITISRNVTNVGTAQAVYKAAVEPPAGIRMEVNPTELAFDAKTKVQTFEITFSPARNVQGDYGFGSLTWSDSEGHSVRMPIAVRPIIQRMYADTS